MRSLIFCTVTFICVIALIKPTRAEELGTFVVTLPQSQPSDDQPETVAADSYSEAYTNPVDDEAITPDLNTGYSRYEQSSSVEQYVPPLVLHNWQWPTQPYQVPSNLPVRGKAMYYNPGVMQKVVRYRLQIGTLVSCPECIGCVALLRAGDLNRRIWLQMDNGHVEGPFLVTDVAARHDIPRLLHLGWAIDVDWDTAKRWGLQMPMVTVLETPPIGWTQTVFAAYQPHGVPCVETSSTSVDSAHQ